MWLYDLSDVNKEEMVAMKDVVDRPPDDDADMKTEADKAEMTSPGPDIEEEPTAVSPGDYVNVDVPADKLNLETDALKKGNNINNLHRLTEQNSRLSHISAHILV